MSEIRRILRLDPVWSVYALCDLDPRLEAWCDWRHAGDDLLLLYRQFPTPILFATAGAAPLVETIDDSEVSLQVPLALEPALRQRFAQVKTKRVIRMWLPGSLDPAEAETLTDASELEHLYEGDEAPDFFHASMLDDGAFKGVRDDEGRLIAVAGTHTVFDQESVATIGNVFVHPAHRGRGLGARVVKATAAALRRRGIETIALNVREPNTNAISLYEKLGFARHSVFLEGQAIAPKRR